MKLVPETKGTLFKSMICRCSENRTFPRLRKGVEVMAGDASAESMEEERRGEEVDDAASLRDKGLRDLRESIWKGLWNFGPAIQVTRVDARV
jgi:hypothetical protein